MARLIQQRASDSVASPLAAELQVTRLINPELPSSPIHVQARSSPISVSHHARLGREMLPIESQIPSPVAHLGPTVPVCSPMELPPYGGVIKQTGMYSSLSPTPRYTKASDMAATTAVTAAVAVATTSSSSSVIRPFPTSASASLGANPGNLLSIHGLLSGSGVSSSSGVPLPSSHIRPYSNTSHLIGHGPFLNHPPYSSSPYSVVSSRTSYMGAPVTPTPRPTYPPIYSSPHVPVPHGLPLHSAYPPHGSPLRPTSSYQHAGFPQAFAAAAAAAAAAVNAEEERRIYRSVSIKLGFSESILANLILVIIVNLIMSIFFSISLMVNKI